MLADRPSIRMLGDIAGVHPGEVTVQQLGEGDVGAGLSAVAKQAQRQAAGGFGLFEGGRAGR
jgi:hypothetical protein